MNNEWVFLLSFFLSRFFFSFKKEKRSFFLPFANDCRRHLGEEEEDWRRLLSLRQPGWVVHTISYNESHFLTLMMPATDSIAGVCNGFCLDKVCKWPGSFFCSSTEKMERFCGVSFRYFYFSSRVLLVFSMWCFFLILLLLLCEVQGGFFKSCEVSQRNNATFDMSNWHNSCHRHQKSLFFFLYLWTFAVAAVLEMVINVGLVLFQFFFFFLTNWIRAKERWSQSRIWERHCCCCCNNIKQDKNEATEGVQINPCWIGWMSMAAQQKFFFPLFSDWVGCVLSDDEEHFSFLIYSSALKKGPWRRLFSPAWRLREEKLLFLKIGLLSNYRGLSTRSSLIVMQKEEGASFLNQKQQHILNCAQQQFEKKKISTLRFFAPVFNG